MMMILVVAVMINRELDKGRATLPNWMIFRKTSKGGGVISDPKNFVAFFRGGKNDEFSGKGGGSLQSEKFRCIF